MINYHYSKKTTKTTATTFPATALNQTRVYRIRVNEAIKVVRVLLDVSGSALFVQIFGDNRKRPDSTRSAGQRGAGRVVDVFDNNRIVNKQNN